MADVGEVLVRLRADISDLERKLGQSQDRLKQTASVAADSGERIGKALGVAAGAGVALLTASLVALTKQAIDSAGALHDLSQSTGIAVKDLSTLKVAAKLADTDVSTLSMSVGILSKNMLNASGGGRFADVMKAVGVETRNADGSLRASFDVLKDLADVFVVLPDGTTKTALAMEALGRGGRAWIPILNEGRAGIERIEQSTRKLGVAVSADFARAADEFGDNLTLVRLGAQGVGQAIAEALLPEVNAVIADVLRWEEANGQLLGQDIAQWVRNMADAINAARPALSWIGGVINQGADLIATGIGRTVANMGPERAQIPASAQAGRTAEELAWARSGADRMPLFVGPPEPFVGPLQSAVTISRERSDIEARIARALRDQSASQAEALEWTEQLVSADALRTHQAHELVTTLESAVDATINLADVLDNQVSTALTGILLGTGEWQDAGRRIGEAFIGELIRSTIREKKLFDAEISANLLDYLPGVAKEGGLSAGANFVSGLFGGGGTGAGRGLSLLGFGAGSAAIPGYAAEMGTRPGFEAAMMGGGTGAGLSSALGAAGLAGGAASMLGSIAGLSSTENMGGSAGAATGALAGALLGGPVGAAIGGLLGFAVGGSLGSLFNSKPTQEHVNMDSIREWVQKSGIAQAQGTIGGRSAWGDHSIIDRVYPGVTDQAQFESWNQGILAVMTAGLGNDKGQAGMATNAFANNEVLLGHSVERMKADLLKLAQTAGVDLETALNKLEEQYVSGAISGEKFGEAAAQTAAILGELPNVIDTSVLALQALDEQGSVTFEHLTKVIEDAQSVMSVGLADTFKKLVTDPNIADASKSLAQAYADTFVNRFAEEMLNGPANAKLTQAVADAEKAAELLAKGDKAGAGILLVQARQEFLAGRAEFLAGAIPIAGQVRQWERSLGIGGLSGIIDEGGLTLPSFDTDSMARVPGAFGSPQLAVVHGGETIRNPQHDDRIAAGIAEIAALLSGGLRGAVQNDLRIVLQLDGRDIAYGLQRVESRQGTPGIILPQKIGRR